MKNSNIDLTCGEIAGLQTMLANFHKSYIYANNDKDMGEDVRFEVRVEHIKKQCRTFDNKLIGAISRDFFCKLEGVFPDETNKDRKWDIHYGKRQIDSMGIFDSAVYRVFSGFLELYTKIKIVGVYHINCGCPFIELEEVDALL